MQIVSLETICLKCEIILSGKKKEKYILFVFFIVIHVYKMCNYFKYHHFLFTASFYRTFWKIMFTITSCLCSAKNFPEGIFWTELFLVCHRTFRIFLTKTVK